ncbi:hypothetical protein [Roseobacter sp. OBYS 0001]|uniref:hypothetical protein n=1 Tax=Roseobacter sp. OBYS 0001 TaxID=882651 RepID=UPI001BC6C8EC|nr:hypothetical protein [Roseobacter sp. OBYS 0001]GIT85410.1 hypothetical protein ROBYS_04260 [Roseobacter sp. OBYS 0001]
MVALTKGRTTPRLDGDLREGAVAANATLFTGAILMRNSSGYIFDGRVGTGAVGVGVCLADVDNTGGSAGDVTVVFRQGTYSFANSAGADEITAVHIGSVAYAVDDQTVARTNGSNTRSPAGVIEGVDARGVWVRFDEALTQAASA